MKPVDWFLHGFLTYYFYFGDTNAFILLVCKLNSDTFGYTFPGEMCLSSIFSCTVYTVCGKYCGFLLSRDPLLDTEQSAGFRGLLTLNLEFVDENDACYYVGLEWYIAGLIGF